MKLATLTNLTHCLTVTVSKGSFFGSSTTKYLQLVTYLKKKKDDTDYIGSLFTDLFSDNEQINSDSVLYAIAVFFYLIYLNFLNFL